MKKFIIFVLAIVALGLGLNFMVPSLFPNIADAIVESFDERFSIARVIDENPINLTYGDSEDDVNRLVKSYYDTKASIKTNFDLLDCDSKNMEITFTDSNKTKTVIHPVNIRPNQSKLESVFTSFNVENGKVTLNYSFTNNTGATIRYIEEAEITCYVNGKPVLHSFFRDFLRDLDNNNSQSWSFTFPSAIDITPFYESYVYLETNMSYKIIN